MLGICKPPDDYCFIPMSTPRFEISRVRALWMVPAQRLTRDVLTCPLFFSLSGLTAFDVLNSTILGTNPEDKVDGLEEEDQSDPRRELVTWGANRNFVLGLQGDSDRHFPERVHLDRTATHASGTEGRQGRTDFESVRVIKIAMEKLHSGLLTDEPKNNFRLCGFGSTTGRLGHNSPHPQFSFEPLKDFAQQRVTDFALGQDHTILCTEKGDVWTFGLNVRRPGPFSAARMLCTLTYVLIRPFRPFLF